MNRILCFVGLLALSVTAQAGTCEDDFQTVGDPRNGLVFMGQVKKPGLSISSALGQLQQLALDGGYQVGNESITDNVGEFFFTQTQNVRTPIVLRAEANGSGEVSLGTKLARGQQAKSDGVSAEICGMLNKLKVGKEGEAIAAAARAKTGAGQVIDAEAPKLSTEIGRDVQKMMAGVNSKGVLGNLMIGSSNYATAGERNEAFAPVVAKYKGRKYRIDGQIYTVSRNQYSGEMQMAYLVTQTRGLLGIRQSSSSNNNNFTIQCTFAPEQAKFFVTLSEGDWVKLSGTVDKIDTQGMSLRDCRQAN